MSIKGRLARLEIPFLKFPPVIFVNDESEIEHAKKDWQLKHKRMIGKNEEVIIFINNLPPDPSQAQMILDCEVRKAEMRKPGYSFNTKQWRNRDERTKRN